MSGILVIRPKGLGDVVRIFPSLKMLREHYPDKKIALLTSPGFGDLLPESLNIDVITLKSRATPKEFLRTIKTVRKYKFDAVYDLYGTGNTALITIASGAPERYGFNYRGRKHAYNHIYQAEKKDIHYLELFEDFFNRFGIPGKAQFVPIEFTETTLEEARKLIPYDPDDISPFLTINPNSQLQSKQWPEENVIELINLWHETFAMPTMLLNSPSEAHITESILKKTGNKAFTHEQTNLKTLAALISFSDIFVSGDTGPMHLSWATGTPTVALFGPFPLHAAFPIGEQHLSLKKDVDCSPCWSYECRNLSFDCMKKLTGKFVFEKILEKYDFETGKSDL